MALKQATLLIVVVVIVALAVGFLGGRALMAPTGPSSDELASLTARVQALEQKVGSGGSGSFKIAYVDMFKVLSKYNGTQGPLAQFQQLQKDIQQKIQDLDAQFQAGKITKAEHDQQVIQLQQQLQQANLQLSAPIQQKIIAIVRQVGQDQGYALVLDNEASQAQASVLYAQAGHVDDITDQIIQKINAQETTPAPGK
jgi:Skp family chaperone for outer membrane proteins